MVAHQVDVVKNGRGLVHLTQDEQHFVVDELLKFFQVAAHVLLQLVADLAPANKQKKIKVVVIVCSVTASCGGHASWWDTPPWK